jgi:DNA-binding response OmpR family regulator
VDIYLPTLYDPVEKKETPEIKSPDAPKTVLLIEDDPMILDISRQLLERLGNRVIQAPTGAEAVRLAETFEGDIHLALLDIILPDMNGKDVYPRITALRPGMKVVVCSGYSLDGTAQDILNAGAQGFLQKPFSLQELSAKVKNILT